MPADRSVMDDPSDEPRADPRVNPRPARPTLADVYTDVVGDLQRHDVANARHEARALIVDAAGLDAVDFVVGPDLVLAPAQCRAISAWLKRRCAGEPLARIRGWQEFYGRRFVVSAATLEPRPDTETLIDAALELVDARHGRNHPWRIIDVGTGSGCLVLTLLAELPQATAVATDISVQALATALHNANELRLADRLSLHHTNFLDGIAGRFELLISNPPYVKSKDIATLEVEVQGHDPVLSLDGGADGLACYRAIGAAAKLHLGDSLMILETACDDDQRVTDAVLSAAGPGVFRPLRVWQDLSGCNRCVALETLC